MVMYYYACRFEVAGKWFRASPPEGWLADWNKGLKIDMVSTWYGFIWQILLTN